MDPDVKTIDFRKLVTEEMLKKEHNYVAVLKCLTSVGNLLEADGVEVVHQSSPVGSLF
jgi:hypothetical protein